LDGSADEINDANINCQLRKDLSAITFNQEASEDKDKLADYFDLPVGIFDLDLRKSAGELNEGHHL
jgi:hypothetical protein